MADDVAITAGSGTTVATDEIAGRHFQRVKLTIGADGTATDVSAGAGAVGAGVPRVTLASDDPGVAHLATIASAVGVAPSTGAGVNGSGVQRVTVATDDALTVAAQAIQATGKTCTTAVTRPADTTAYATNDCWSDSTSAPTSGGFTFTGAARASGGTGLITDILIHSTNDPATLLQGELWIFDAAITNVNDNAAFALSDTDVALLVAVVPFSMVTTAAGSGTNSYAHLTGLNIGYTCVGSANLRFLVKVKNAYTPANAEVLTFRMKCQYTS